MSRTLSALGLVLAITVIGTTANGQEFRRDGFQQIDADQFGIVLLFYDYDEGLPLESRIVETIPAEEAVIEKIVFTSTNDERVPGYLALPRAGSAPYPCVLLVHGLNSSKDWWWDREPASDLTNGLLRAGIAVFTIDLRFHGERSAPNDYQGPMYLAFENTLFVRSRDMTIQSTIDCRRALDYLATRSNIDSSRVAVAGYSMGGMIALYLSVLEPGLTAVVGCAVPSHPQLLPADPYNFAARIELPTLLLAGKTDWHSSPEDARTLLELIPSPTKELVLYDSGHQLPVEYTGAALEWLVRHLDAVEE